MNYIEVNNVVKQYSGHLALDHVSLNVPQGSIYGLLGPNGAGKTTLLRILNMITRPDSGTVTIAGHPLTESDIANIGYLPEERGLYKKMKVGEHIVYLARLKGMPKDEAVKEMDAWLERFELTEWKNKKVEALSKGMQQKVQFISTVIHNPSLLIFDEPFSGFDPLNAMTLKKEILRLKDMGTTILFSTHNMESVEEICEQITLINHSKVVLQGAVDEIKQSHKKHLYRVALDSGEELAAAPNLFSIENADKRQYTIKLNPQTQVKDVISWLNEHHKLTAFEELLPSMNEIFIETVKKLNDNES